MIKGLSDEQINMLIKDHGDDKHTISYRSTKVCNDIYFIMRRYIECNNLDFDIKRTMSGFNDRIVISLKDGRIFISFIIIWCYSDAELTVVMKNGEDYKFIGNEYLDINNRKDIPREPDEINDGLLNNTIKYYSQDFSEHQDEIIIDMKTILNKMEEGNLDGRK